MGGHVAARAGVVGLFGGVPQEGNNTAPIPSVNRIKVLNLFDFTLDFPCSIIERHMVAATKSLPRDDIIAPGREKNSATRI